MHFIGRNGLTRQGVVAIMRSRVLEAIDLGLVELEPGMAGDTVRSLSAHSFRVGLTQDLFAAGEDGAGIALALRWSSPTTALRYARALAVGSNAAARVLGKLRGGDVRGTPSQFGHSAMRAQSGTRRICSQPARRWSHHPGIRWTSTATALRGGRKLAPSSNATARMLRRVTGRAQPGAHTATPAGCRIPLAQSWKSGLDTVSRTTLRSASYGPCAGLAGRQGDCRRRRPVRPAPVLCDLSGIVATR